MASAVELTPGQPLYTLLDLSQDGNGGVDEVRRLAALSVNGLGASGATVLGRKVSEWPTADLVKEIRKAFPLDPFTLIAKAWGQIRKLRKAIDASRGPPPSSQSVTLAKHDIEAKYEPRMVLEVNGIDWLDVRLGLTLKLTFESAHLEVLDGKLTSVSFGSPAGALTLQCQGQEVAAFSRTIKFAPTYRFDTPLDLPGEDAVRSP